MLTEGQRKKANREMREQIRVDDMVVNRSDGFVHHGYVVSVSTRVKVSWVGARPADVDGKRTREAYYQPVQFKATGKERPKWRLLPFARVMKG